MQGVQKKPSWKKSQSILYLTLVDLKTANIQNIKLGSLLYRYKLAVLLGELFKKKEKENNAAVSYGSFGKKEIIS